MTTLFWQTTRFRLDLARPLVMGIVNLTPDSFSDGGTYAQTVNDALKHAERLLKDGADILDIGGESTRPNAAYVSPEEEWARVLPILREVQTWQVPISLDTRRTAVMRLALEQGWADIINDVQGLEDEGALALLAQQENTGVCMMHMQGLPENMQQQPHYADVVQEVSDYLAQRSQVAQLAGISASRLMLDVGFGFGKTLAHNCLLMKNLDKIQQQLHLPMLVGVSRKRMIGELTGQSVPSERVAGSVAGALFAAQQGAAVLRVHDVRQTVDALKVWQGFVQ